MDSYVVNACRTTIVRDAWRRGQDLTVHGWIYSLNDGRISDLGVCISAWDEIVPTYEAAVTNLD